MSELAAHREDVAETPVFQKHNPLMGARQRRIGHSTSVAPTSNGNGNGYEDDAADAEARQQRYTIDFIRKFIIYAKGRFRPQLTEAAQDHISEEYARLRSKADVRTQPITARTLETLIRLAAAHAKSRLSHTIEQEDAAVAVALVNYALYHEAQPRSKAATAAAAAAEGSETATGRRPIVERSTSTTPTTAGVAPAKAAAAAAIGRSKGKERMDAMDEEDGVEEAAAVDAGAEAADAMDEEAQEEPGFLEDDDEDGEAQVTDDRYGSGSAHVFQKGWWTHISSRWGCCATAECGQ